MSFEEFREEFISFLEKEGAKEAFERNLERYADSDFALPLDQFLEEAWRSQFFSIKGLVVGAFNWGNTEEGVAFWAEIDKKWKQRWEELEIKEVKSHDA